METTLFLLLLLACVQAYRTGRVEWLPLLCTLTFLARFEGGAIAVVLAWRLWKERRLPKIVSYLPAAVLIALYLFFNLHYYGALLPQSAFAKFGQGMSGNWGKWPMAFLDIQPNVYLPIFGSWLIAPIMIALFYFASRTERLRPYNRVVVPFLILLGAFYILFNIPNYHWYYAPFLFFGYMYAAQLIPQRLAPQIATVVLVVCVWKISAVTVHHMGEDPEYVVAAKWLCANTPPNATVAAAETGTIGYNCDRPVIDMIGLTTPQNARYTAHRDFTSWLGEHPDYVVAHDPALPWEATAANSPDYVALPMQFGHGVYVLQRKGK